MGGFNLQELMSQAKQQYETLQKKMQETVVEGSAGGGTVTVKMDGSKQVLGIKIDPEAVKAGDLEMLQDLITAAINGVRSPGIARPAVGDSGRRRDRRASARRGRRRSRACSGPAAGGDSCHRARPSASPCGKYAVLHFV